jgi:hypothetical protein
MIPLQEMETIVETGGEDKLHLYTLCKTALSALDRSVGGVGVQLLKIAFPISATESHPGRGHN